MDKCDKLLEKARRSPNNLRFTELCQLAECYGFTFQRQHSSHHIYKRPGHPLTLTFPECTGKVKATYVKQLLNVIEELELGDSNEE
jgi:predicted RNA binding protein YcfA (HicA-like mRNA interferase family)